MDAQTIEITKMLCCSACGVERGCACDAPAAYLSPAEQRERRRKRAAELYKSGLSMQQIADQLRVAVNTISQDLADVDFPEIGKKQPKTKKNPKGAGRPKGSKTRFGRSRKLTPELELRAIEMLFGQKMGYRAVAKELGLGAHVIEALAQRETGKQDARADPIVDPATLPKTTQEKLAVALRQQQRQERAEFEQRVQAEFRKRVEKTFPNLEKMEREARDAKQTYERLRRESKKLGTISDWNNLMFCLHPDTRRSASDERFDRALAWVQSKKFAITGEK